MDTRYIEPFVDATVNVIKEFYNEDAVVKTPFFSNKDEDFGWDLSAVIGIAGDTKGVVTISFPKDLIVSLTEKLVGYEIEEIDDDVIDSTCEVVNIIAGNAKKGLEEFKLVISLPSIVRGSSHKIEWPSSRIPIISIPFELPDGLFHVSVGLENIIK